MKVKGLENFKKAFRKESKAVITDGLESKTKELVEDLKAATPVDTGTAQEGWEVKGNQIENLVPYIEPLNEGSSKQAPSYFIERTLLNIPGVSPNGIIVKTKN
jgi:hypothetical protein